MVKTLKVWDNETVPLITLIASGVGFLCVLLALIVTPGGLYSTNVFGIDVHVGRGVGYWFNLIFAIASAAGAIMLYLAAQKAAKRATLPAQ